MMEIQKNKEGNKMVIALTGRLDTHTAPELEKEIRTDLNEITELIFDFENLEYISSAGLRVLLSAQKLMSGDKTMTVKNVNDSIMEIFEVTGFDEILTVE